MPDSTTFAAWFLPAATGRRLCVLWRPNGRPPQASLLLIPPFGEEMNKSRRTLALSARRFARAGYAVMLLDLFGTGDSEGEFGDATWSAWVDDLHLAIGWLGREFAVPVQLWAVRSGALLALDVASLAPDAPLLLWQPVVNGDTFLTHLLRMKVAADTFADRNATTSTRELKAQLTSGNVVEVAGYELNPNLVLPMSERSLSGAPAPNKEVFWLDTGVAATGGLSIPAQKTAEAWRASGCLVNTQYVQGEPFWMTLEITENTALADQSLRMMEAALA